MTRFNAARQPPRLPACEALPGPEAPAALPEGLDDVTLGYVAAMREAFDQLRQAAGQLAGVLMLGVASGHGVAGHPMLTLAETALREAEDAIRGRRAPARARHHHRHLLQASAHLGTALAAARLHRRADDDAATDAVMLPLRAGFTELQRAANVLPGFEVVAFSQGCCARHAPPPAGLIRTTT